MTLINGCADCQPYSGIITAPACLWRLLQNTVARLLANKGCPVHWFLFGHLRWPALKCRVLGYVITSHLALKHALELSYLLIRALGNTCNIHLSIVMQWQVGESPCSVCRQSQEALTEQKFCEVWGFIISIQLYTLLDILTTRLCSSKVDFSFITEADMSLE